MDPAIWIVVAATIFSGFFALSGFSLRSVSRAKLEDAFAGPRGRKRLDAFDKHLNALQLTVTLCAMLANLVLLVAVVYLMGASDGQWGQMFIAIAIAGAIIAVFGVAIPHAWSSYRTESILAVTYPVLMFFRFLLYPITAMMMVFDLPIRRLTGTTDEEYENSDEARQEILQAAVEGQAEGTVDADEVEMIESVMELDETDAAEIMTPRTDIFALEVSTDCFEAARAIQQAGHTRVPLYEDNLDNIIGMIYAKDLLRYVGGDCNATPLKSIARKPYFVPETKPLDDLLREFKRRKIHIAIVLDEYGGTAGLVSIEDILEEIVGDISDEYDRVTESQIKRIDFNTLEVDGRLRVDDLNDALELELPEDEDYDTVAGFAVSQLGYIPRVGETFAADEAEFTIIHADERKISRIRVHKPKPNTAEE